MANRLCEVQEPLEATIAVLHNPVAALSADEWVVLKEVASVLKPFDIVTTEVSAEKSVPASKIIMLSRGLMCACRKTESQLSTEVAKTLITHLCDGLRKRFGNVEKCLGLHVQLFWIQDSRRRDLRRKVFTPRA